MADLRRYLLAGILGAVAIAVSVAIRLTVEDGIPAASQSSASTMSPASSAASAMPDRPDIACGELRTRDATGQPVPEFFLDQVRRVHGLACRGDVEALIAELNSNPGSDQGDVVVLVRSGRAFGEIAAVLQTTPSIDQGGLTYCLPDTGAATFARGTSQRPGGWVYAPYASSC